MSPLGEVHTHYGVPGIHKSKKCGEIGICTAVRLNICMFCSEKLFCPVARDVLDNVNVLTSAIVTL